MSFFGAHLNLSLLIIFNSDVFSLDGQFIAIGVSFEVDFELIFFYFRQDMALSYSFKVRKVGVYFVS